jgi:hypothetical protein
VARLSASASVANEKGRSAGARRRGRAGAPDGAAVVGIWVTLESYRRTPHGEFGRFRCNVAATPRCGGATGMQRFGPYDAVARTTSNI